MYWDAWGGASDRTSASPSQTTRAFRIAQRNNTFHSTHKHTHTNYRRTNHTMSSNDNDANDYHVNDKTTLPDAIGSVTIVTAQQNHYKHKPSAATFLIRSSPQTIKYFVRGIHSTTPSLRKTLPLTLPFSPWKPRSVGEFTPYKLL